MFLQKKKKTNPNLNTRTTFSFSVFHHLLFIKTTQSHPLCLSFPLSLVLSNPTPQEKEESSESEVDSVLVGLRLIPFGFDSFESKVASGLVLALRFGFEVSIWFF